MNPDYIYHVIKGNDVIDITELVQSSVWSGEKETAPRKMEVRLSKSKYGGNDDLDIKGIEGKGFIFYIKKDGKTEEYMRGIIFKAGIEEQGMTLTVYDNMIYLPNNEEDYVFKNKKASEITKKVFDDFGISYDEIVDTGYKIPYLIFEGDDLYDIIRKAIYLTYKHTKVKYILVTRKGKISLIKKKDNTTQFVLSDELNISDYSYESSIEDTRTKVKLVNADEEDKKITVTVSDGDGIKNFGLMQYFEKVSEKKMTKSKLKKRAEKELKERKKPKKTISLEKVLGVPEVITGKMVYAVLHDADVKRSFYVENDVHTFENNTHIMTVELVETWEIEEIDAGSTEKEESSSKSDSKGGKVEGGEGSVGTGKGADIVATARSFKGRLRYVFGSKSIVNGTGDCSGFSKYVYLKHGINIGDGTSTQVARGRYISPSDAKPGDLIFFKGTYRAGVSHVGIVTTSGKFVGLQSSGCTEVSYTSGYWASHFMQIRRVL